MNKSLRLTLVQTTMAAVGIACFVPHSVAAAERLPMSRDCATPEHRQLDFWIGDWDTFESDTPGGQSIARARVKSIAEGCAIHELYEQNDGLIGESILSYDPVRKHWQQTWVTNRGALMVIVGKFEDGALVLQGDVHLKDGTSVMQRITWKAQGMGVRESAVLSRDGGKTWTPAFDVLFRARAGGDDRVRTSGTTYAAPPPSHPVTTCGERWLKPATCRSPDRSRNADPLRADCQSRPRRLQARVGVTGRSHSLR